jgi:SAM-dependent methyltransferase
MEPVSKDSAQFTEWLRDRRFDTPSERYLFRREYAFVSQLLGDTSRPRWLLEVCSGDGWIALPLHGAGLRVMGLDINPVPLNLLRKRASDMPLVLGNGMRLPFSAGSLGGVVAIQCLYFLDYLSFLQECSRVLCKGGLFIFETLNRHSYKWGLKKLRRCLGLGPTAEWYDRQLNVAGCGQVLRVVRDYGFDIQAVSGYGWIPFTRKSGSGLVDAMARVERTLRLDRWYEISPRILVAARKSVQ